MVTAALVILAAAGCYKIPKKNQGPSGSWFLSFRAMPLS